VRGLRFRHLPCCRHSLDQPTLELLERDPRKGAERMRRWEREHADLAKLAPAATMIGNLYRYAAAAGR